MFCSLPCPGPFRARLDKQISLGELRCASILEFICLASHLVSILSFSDWSLILLILYGRRFLFLSYSLILNPLLCRLCELHSLSTTLWWYFPEKQHKPVRSSSHWRKWQLYHLLRARQVCCRRHQCLWGWNGQWTAVSLPRRLEHTAAVQWGFCWECWDLL